MSVPSISSVNGGSAIPEGATAVTVIGTNLTSATLAITQTGVSVAQTIGVAFGATGGSFNLVVEPGSGSQLAFTDATYLTNAVATTGGGSNVPFAVTVAPPAGLIFQTLASVNPNSIFRITAVPDLVPVDQLEAAGDVLGTTAPPVGLVLNNDATYFFSSGNAQENFYVRAYDSVGLVWSAWALQTVISSASTGALNVVFSPTLQAPIALAPLPATVAMAGVATPSFGNTTLTPSQSAATLVSAAVRLAVSPARTSTGSVGLSGASPGLTLTNVVFTPSTNPIGVNVSAGGAAAFSYEGFPQFKNRIREGRGFTLISDNTTQVPLSPAGWPTTDWSSLLYEGNPQAWLTGTFTCGFTLVNATDTVTVAGTGSWVASNVVKVGAQVTFNLVANTGAGGFKVTGTTAGAANVFAYLPAYPGSSIDDPTQASAYTNEYIAHIKQFRFIRWMHPANSPRNTLVGTAANRKTPANTQSQRHQGLQGGGANLELVSKPGIGATSATWNANWLLPSGQYGVGMGSAGNTCGRVCTMTQGSPNFTWDPSQPLTEAVNVLFTSAVGEDGYPIEWAIAQAKAAGIGVWICLPLLEDGTSFGAGSYAASVMDALNSMGFTGEVFFEPANEIWNYQAATLNGIIQFLGFTGALAVPQYMGFRAHALGTLGHAKFGSDWGSRVKQVLAWQTGGNGLSFFFKTLSYMSTTYGNVSSDIQYLAIAPYTTPTIGNTDSVPTIQGYVANGQGTSASDGPRQALRVLSENIGTVAMAYGLQLITYEGGVQWNAVNQSNANVGLAIMDPGMTPAMESYYTGLANSPFTIFSHFSDGVDAVNSNANPVDELSGSWASLVASGSPTQTALLAFTGGMPTPTRNLIANVGDSIDCINYVDNNVLISSAYPFLGQLNAFATGPHYGTGGYIPYEMFCPAAGTINLQLTVNSTAAGATDVEVNGVIVSSNVTIPNFSGIGFVQLGNVPVNAGCNYICLGRSVVTQPGVVPKSITRVAAFDFYLSSSGSNTNSGTLASPWAITAINTKQSTYAGKRLGILPGTYDVSSLMGTNETVAALTISGGSSTARTYIGSSDVSGIYLPRTATLDAKGASGFFGGGNSNASPIMAARSGTNFWTVDGLRLTGFSLWAFHVGDSPSGGTNPTNWTIQNCEFTGGNATSSTVANGVNLAPIIIYSSVTGLVTNNWFHDNSGWPQLDGPGHFSAVYQWGLGNSVTSGTTFTQNTIVNSGGLHGKEHSQQGTTVAYNYIDWSAGPSGQNGSCVQGFDGAPDSGLTQTTSIHHNVLIANYQILDLQAELGNGGWSTACNVYNNTLITLTGIVGAGFDWYEATSGSKLLSWYNNLVFDNGHAPVSGAYGYALVNVDAFSLCDYNIWGGHSPWSTVPSGAHSSASATAHATFASWQAAIGGLDVHSSSNSTNPFTIAGTFADQYQVQSGSPAFGTGRVSGVSTGVAVNVGAFDGTGRPGANWVT